MVMVAGWEPSKGDMYAEEDAYVYIYAQRGSAQEWPQPHIKFTPSEPRTATPTWHTPTSNNDKKHEDTGLDFAHNTKHLDEKEKKCGFMTRKQTECP